MVNEIKNDICPECGRKKAHNLQDVMDGLCPKWWAIFDEAAEKDCESFSVEGPLPPWASHRSQGEYTELGAQLCTRDGRRCGNAFVDNTYTHEKLGVIVEVITDAGSKIKLTLPELEGLFYEPKYVMDLEKARKRILKLTE
jgi:hypothetical protein